LGEVVRTGCSKHSHLMFMKFALKGDYDFDGQGVRKRYKNIRYSTNKIEVLFGVRSRINVSYMTIMVVFNLLYNNEMCDVW